MQKDTTCMCHDNTIKRIMDSFSEDIDEIKRDLSSIRMETERFYKEWEEIRRDRYQRYQDASDASTRRRIKYGLVILAVAVIISIKLR
jgi:hypothetical protein